MCGESIMSVDARRRQAGFFIYRLRIGDEAFTPPCAKSRAMDDLVLVAGGGAMGAGIAFVTAQAGYRVEVVEPDAASRDRARDRMQRAAERGGDAAIAQRVTFLEAMASLP